MTIKIDMGNNIVIIIPTYNARQTIVDAISGVRMEQPNAQIIVVDDSSPDKTAGVIQVNFKKDNNIRLIVRQKKGGRGSAIIEGIKQGLKDPSIHYFIEMDADLCHNPKYIAKLVTACHHADVVIASKYLKSSTIRGLPFKRKILSRLMNFGARIILQVPITDYSNGFRCYSRRAAEYICKRKFVSKGFVVLSEIIYLCHKKGFRIIEIPFDFKQKETSQKSNLRFSEMSEAFLTLFKLRLQS